jgi:hypothetical protein
MASRANGAERWSIVTGEDGRHVIEVQTGDLPLCHAVELVNTQTGCRRTVGRYSCQGRAADSANWFGTIGTVRAEVVSLPN